MGTYELYFGNKGLGRLRSGGLHRGRYAGDSRTRSSTFKTTHRTTTRHDSYSGYSDSPHLAPIRNLYDHQSLGFLFISRTEIPVPVARLGSARFAPTVVSPNESIHLVGLSSPEPPATHVMLHFKSGNLYIRDWILVPVSPHRGISWPHSFFNTSPVAPPPRCSRAHKPIPPMTRSVSKYSC